MSPLLVSTLLVAASGGVQLIYQDGQPSGIRNAAVATGNGRVSVAGPCGGVETYGANGVGYGKRSNTVTRPCILTARGVGIMRCANDVRRILLDGSTVTLAARYTAGHTGAFRMAYACDRDRVWALQAQSATVPADNCHVQGNASAYGEGVDGGATAATTDVIIFTCQLPLLAALQAADKLSQACTIGLLDHRGWGGCVDVSVVAEADPLPSPEVDPLGPVASPSVPGPWAAPSMSDEPPAPQYAEGVFLHFPPGSNNRLDEGGSTRINNYRLFDSQNPAMGGYGYGGDASNKAAPLSFIVGSRLEVAWSSQYGCAAASGVECQLVIQYMCNDASGLVAEGPLRDGTNINSPDPNNPQARPEPPRPRATRLFVLALPPPIPPLFGHRLTPLAVAVGCSAVPLTCSICHCKCCAGKPRLARADVVLPGVRAA